MEFERAPWMVEEREPWPDDDGDDEMKDEMKSVCTEKENVYAMSSWRWPAKKPEN